MNTPANSKRNYSFTSESELIKFLSRSHELRLELSSINRRMMDLRERAESISPSYSYQPKNKPSESGGKVAHYATEIVALLEDEEQREQELIRAEREIEEVILLLAPSKIRAILYDFYINDIPVSSTNLNIATLGDIYNYTESYIKMLLRRGRRQIMEICQK